MSLKEVILPAMGEGITDATIIRWLVKEGDWVKIDQPLVEIATDKVDSEVPASVDGTIQKILSLAGNIPKVGETIALIAFKDDNQVIDEPREIFNEINISQEPKNDEILTSITLKRRSHLSAITGEYIEPDNLPFAPPYIQLLVQKLNISLSDIALAFGLQKGDIILKKHIKEYLKTKDYAIAEAGSSKIESSMQEQNPIKIQNDSLNENIQNGNYEVIEMSRIRKLIAGHMVESHQTIPIVTSFIEVDVTNLFLWREQVKDQFLLQYNTKLTLTPLFIEAIAATLKSHPEVNVSLDGDKIILKKSINIGLAVIIPDSNLIVPVIRNADKLNLPGIAQAVNDLSERARNNSLNPHEITNSTFTVTNIGTFGTLTGTPLINLPEAAILSIGAINKKPYVVKTGDSYTIGIRDIVVLSLAYDHRVIDGGLGGQFLKTLSDFLNRFDISREI